MAAEVERKLRRAYQPSADGCRLGLRRVGCAPSRPPERAVFEDGSGHGGVVAITELRKDGDGWSVTRVTLNGGGEDAPARVAVIRGRAPDSAIAPALARAAAALAYRLTERPPPGRDVVLGSWSSSGDFFVRVAVDGLPEREFAGYPGADVSRLPARPGRRPRPRRRARRRRAARRFRRRSCARSCSSASSPPRASTRTSTGGCASSTSPPPAASATSASPRA